MDQPNDEAIRPQTAEEANAARITAGTGHEKPADVSAVAFSNAIRLSGRQWIGVGVFPILLIVLAPSLWKQHETFSLEPDYRMPHELSNDYWFYERYAALAVNRFDTLLIGDSVVWGEFVNGDETFSHYLNKEVGEERFANLGLEGAHPLALNGLVEHYAGGVSGKNVILHCNPEWLRSPQTDLQDPKATVNHPRLVPQFRPRIPAISKEEISPRIGVVVEQHVPFTSWTAHLQQAYYNQADIPSWTIKHPYDNPLQPLTRPLPSPDTKRRPPPKPWFKNDIGMQDYPWVDMAKSLQWRAFRNVVNTLQIRDNRVFVIVGSFNEHLLKPASLHRYQQIKTTIEAWLQAERIPYLMAPLLPSNQYGDASHPFAEGYAALARQLLDNPAFKTTFQRR